MIVDCSSAADAFVVRRGTTPLSGILVASRETRVSDIPAKSMSLKKAAVAGDADSLDLAPDFVPEHLHAARDPQRLLDAFNRRNPFY